MQATQTLIATALLISAASANAALVGSADGKTVYDTDSNTTWLSNANLAETNAFGLTYGFNYGNDVYGNPSIIMSNGTMTWGGAMKWIAAMNAANYLGYSDWGLPTTLQPDLTCSIQKGGNVSYGYNCTYSKMGHLFYNELGGLVGQSIVTVHNANYGLFHNVKSGDYWSGTEYAPNTYYAWYFGFDDGYQYTDVKGLNFYAMVVRPGQVAAVPVPAAAWLLSSGLLGLMGVTRRRLAPCRFESFGHFLPFPSGGSTLKGIKVGDEG